MAHSSIGMTAAASSDLDRQSNWAGQRIFTQNVSIGQQATKKSKNNARRLKKMKLSYDKVRREGFLNNVQERHLMAINEDDGGDLASPDEPLSVTKHPRMRESTTSLTRQQGVEEQGQRPILVNQPRIQVAQTECKDPVCPDLAGSSPAAFQMDTELGASSTELQQPIRIEPAQQVDDLCAATYEEETKINLKLVQDSSADEHTMFDHVSPTIDSPNLEEDQT